MERVIKASFVSLFIFLIGVTVFHMATPFLTVLFSFFALSEFRRFSRMAFSLGLFIVLVLALFYGFGFFVKGAIANLPLIAIQSIPHVIEYAKKYHFELPFTDIESFRAVAIEEVRNQAGDVAKFAEISVKQIVLLLLGLIVAISLFLNQDIDLNAGKYPIRNNLYTLYTNEVAMRFKRFYEAFVTVMGAQLIIACINTFFTAIFVLIIALPFAKTIIVITFICSLFPIVGNLFSNLIIFGVAITKSLHLAIIALVFLVVLHKLQYLLNSKIIGSRIKSPAWLTLLGLIVGERLMGIPGMILAPVLLYYFKLEGSQIEVSLSTNTTVS